MIDTKMGRTILRQIYRLIDINTRARTISTPHFSQLFRFRVALRAALRVSQYSDPIPTNTTLQLRVSQYSGPNSTKTTLQLFWFRVAHGAALIVSQYSDPNPTNTSLESVILFSYCLQATFRTTQAPNFRSTFPGSYSV